VERIEMKKLFSRRSFLKTAWGGSAALLLPPWRGIFRQEAGLHLYVGTYTRGKSEGIYHCRFMPASGELRLTGLASPAQNPSFLVADASSRRLYAVHEQSVSGTTPGGGLSAYDIESGSGILRLLNTRSSGGADPCHLALDPGGKFIYVANYSGGSVAVVGVGEDGSLGDLRCLIRHQGSGPMLRQQSPHVHAVNAVHAETCLYVADLGTDRIMMYRRDAGSGILTAARQPWLRMSPGSGPRHLAFHPDGRTLYVVNELDSTICRCSAVDGGKEALEIQQTVRTVPSSFTGVNYPADVHVAPGGRFVYVSNRGHDSIAAFGIDQATGDLTLAAVVSTEGAWPRNFTLDPSGRHLLVANQRSDSIVAFRLDDRSGIPVPSGHSLHVPEPTSLVFA
jgi:6-phosphogluconolactonase